MNPEILRPLPEPAGGPPRVDPPAAVRRPRRRIILALMCAVVLVAVLVAVPVALHGRDRADPPIGQHCVETVLPVPSGGRYTRATAIDSTGRYAVGEAAPHKFEPVIWHDGAVRVLPYEGSYGAWPIDVNSRGDVLISEGTALSIRIVALVAGRRYVVDGNPATIGDNGEMAGAVLAPDQEPAVWRTPAASPTRLATPDGWTGVVWDIDRDGTLGGTLMPPHGQYQAAVWSSDGTLRMIPLPDLPDVRGAELRALRDGVALLIASSGPSLVACFTTCVPVCSPGWGTVSPSKAVTRRVRSSVRPGSAARKPPRCFSSRAGPRYRCR